MRRPGACKDFEQQYQDGLITQGEKYNKVVDAWASVRDKVPNEMMNGLRAVRMRTAVRQMNSVYMMATPVPVVRQRR